MGQKSHEWPPLVPRTCPEASKILTLVVHGLDAERPEMKSTAKMLQVALQISVLKATSLGLRARARTLPPKSAQSPSLIDCPVRWVPEPTA